jgi:solute carrier family 6 GABA transporter-like protein 6/8/11/12/13
MYVAFFETVAIVWCYGAGRLAKNVADMTGKEPSVFFIFSWKVSAPCLIGVRRILLVITNLILAL